MQLTVDRCSQLKNERSVGRGEPAVTVPRGCSLYWDDEGSVAALRELDLRLEAGTLTLIVGKTGSGKSALLQVQHSAHSR